MTTDSALITASLIEPSRFGDLYRRHAGPIFRYASRRLDAGAAEDVLSDAFVIAFAKRARLDHAWQSALPWLFGIATREIARYRKAEVRAWDAMRRDPSADIADMAEAAGDRVDAAVAVKELGTALHAMPSRDRDVLLLYAWADLDYAAIAVALGIPIGTVRSRLNRARRILRTAPGLTNSINEGDDDERPHPEKRRRLAHLPARRLTPLVARRPSKSHQRICSRCRTMSRRPTTTMKAPASVTVQLPATGTPTPKYRGTDPSRPIVPTPRRMAPLRHQRRPPTR